MRNENLETEIVCQFHITNKNVLGLLEDKDLIDGEDCIFRRNITYDYSVGVCLCLP